MVKTAAEANGGKGWFWMEMVNTTDPDKTVVVGNGVTLCTSCHSIGDDFVLTDYPLLK